MVKRLQAWITRRPKSIRFWSVLTVFAVSIGALLFLSVVWSGPLEARNGLTLNLVSEVIGALLVAFLLDGVIRRAAEERDSEHAALQRQQAELEEYRQIIEQYVDAYRGKRQAEEAIQQLEQLEEVYDVFSARRHMEDVLAKNSPEGRERIARGLRTLIERMAEEEEK